jgi:hypothetical protein
MKSNKEGEDKLRKKNGNKIRPKYYDKSNLNVNRKNKPLSNKNFSNKES